MLKYEVMAVTRFWKLKEGVKETVHDFFIDETGDTNLISIVIVLVLVIGMAAIFRKNIESMVTKMWEVIGRKFNDASGTTGASIEKSF